MVVATVLCGFFGGFYTDPNQPEVNSPAADGIFLQKN